MTLYLGWDYYRAPAYDADCLAGWHSLMARVRDLRARGRHTVKIRDHRRRPSLWTAAGDIARLLDHCAWFRRRVHFNRLYRRSCGRPDAC